MSSAGFPKAALPGGLLFWRRLGANSAAVLAVFLAGTVAAEHIVVGCIGDYGSGSVYQGNVARLVKLWKPGLVITVGDNNYPSGAANTIDENIGQFYHEFISPYRGLYGRGATQNRFFPSLGNHDYHTKGAKPYFAYFDLPGNERYYTFTNGPVQFFCINSDPEEPDGITVNSRQAEWLKGALAASTSPWRLVYFHHAPYSSGLVHGSYTEESDKMRWPFRQWGASVVLSGHDHVYERLRVDGLTYFINGLGGMSWDKFHWPPHPASVKRFTGDFGAMRLDATETNMTFRFITWRNEIADLHVICQPSAATTFRRAGISSEVAPQ